MTFNILVRPGCAAKMSGINTGQKYGTILPHTDDIQYARHVLPIAPAYFKNEKVKTGKFVKNDKVETLIFDFHSSS